MASLQRRWRAKARSVDSRRDLPAASPEYFHPPPMAIPVQNDPPQAWPPSEAAVKSALKSEKNLVNDRYLRERMDEHGWVSVRTIAAFPRVLTWTTDPGLIQEVLRDSYSVEVAERRMRRRGDWQRWPMPQQPRPTAPLLVWRVKAKATPQ